MRVFKFSNLVSNTTPTYITYTLVNSLPVTSIFSGFITIVFSLVGKAQKIFGHKKLLGFVFANTKKFDGLFLKSHCSRHNKTVLYHVTSSRKITKTSHTFCISVSFFLGKKRGKTYFPLILAFFSLSLLRSPPSAHPIFSLLDFSSLSFNFSKVSPPTKDQLQNNIFLSYSKHIDKHSGELPNLGRVK